MDVIGESGFQTILEPLAEALLPQFLLQSFLMWRAILTRLCRHTFAVLRCRRTAFQTVQLSEPRVRLALNRFGVRRAPT